MTWEKGQSGNPKGSYNPIKARAKVERQALLSGAYKGILNELIDEETREAMDLPEGSTWAYVIGRQVVKRAIGTVPDDKICFKAITELRETTEGKTPEKIIAAGSNLELTALAQIMRGDPAPPDDDLLAEDAITEKIEDDFHSSNVED
jgi:hypothetical protein